MKNKFGFVGFFSLLGILGIVTEYRWLMLFFATAAYFPYFRVIPDEMFKDTVKKCAAAAFFANLAAVVIAMPILWLIGVENFILSAGWFGWTAAYCTFFFSFPMMEKRERRNASKDS